MTLKNTSYIFFILLLSVLKIDGQTAYQYLKMGDKFFINADYYTSFYYYNKARETDSNLLESTYKLAETSRLINDYKNAYLFYDHVLKTDKYKSFPLSEFWMGLTSKFLGNYIIAKNHFQRFNDRYSYTDYYKTKCIQEIKSVNWAINNSNPSSTTIINRMGDEINSNFSEFAAMELEDSFYQFSSLKEKQSSLKDKNKEFLSRIYTMKIDEKKWKENKELFNWLDKYDANIANGSFSEDGLRFYFNICENINISDLRCEIYLSELKNGSWQEPIKLNDDINLKNYTNTQPNEGDNKILYFVSDRPNGIGKLDIWYTNRNEDGSFSKVENLGNNINSIDNEITPYFDKASNRLYFSSDWYEGYGGYDIFYSIKNTSEYTNPINLKTPINSSFNDLYFNLNKTNNHKGYLSSNRKGSLFLKGESCCNDIFKVDITDSTKKSDTLIMTTIIQKDSVKLVNNNNIKTNDTTTKSNITSTISRLKNLLPVVVYFHNDIPNPRSVSDTTDINYLSSYEAYTVLKNEYINEYSKVDSLNALKEINSLFYTKIDLGYRNLLIFSSILKEALISNKEVQLTIEAYCSPLALNDYNIHLANRRIASLKNYIASFDNGFYLPYLNNGHLKLINAPFGEERAKSGISDDRLDTKNSVYNPKAAVERRVAIIAIDIL